MTRAAAPRLTDEQLVKASQHGDQYAASELVRRYRGLIATIAEPFYFPGATPEDVIAEGFVGFSRAIHDYDASRGVKFKDFSMTCAKRMLITALKKSQRMKHVPLNEALSLSASISQTNPDLEGHALEESIGEHHTERAVIAIDHFRQVRNCIETRLTRREQTAAVGALVGASHQEIATALGCDNVKPVDNALMRARHKLRQTIDLEAA